MKKVISVLSVLSMLIVALSMSGCVNKNRTDPAQLINVNDSCVTVWDSGDYTYHPPEETIDIDTQEGVLFFNNLITVYVTEELSSDDVQELLDYVDGELVGITRNGVNSLEIKVEQSSLNELKDKANSLYDFECVLFSDYDFPLGFSQSDFSDDPWASDGNSIDDKGNEEYPDGNDWWAEAVGAYTAWELCEDITERINVAVVDTGVNYAHEELSEVSNFSSFPNTPDYHGTAVAGVIASESDNGVGIRGIASENANVVSLDVDVDGIIYSSNNEIISTYCSLVTSGNRVVNLSMIWGNVYTKKEFDAHFYEDVIIKGECDNWYDYFFAKGFELTVNGFYYDDYMQFVTARAQESGATFLKIIINLLYNGYDDFIFVNGAGNGYDNSTGEPGCDASLSGCFAAINEPLFDEAIPANVRQKLKERGIDYNSIVDHKIIVAAVEHPDANGNYRLASWSSYGDNVDICAPGIDIYMCPSYDESNISNNNVYETFSGTSAATPIVSAGVALTWAAFPDASAATIKKLIVDSALSYAVAGSEGDTRTEPYPVLNIGESVKAALPENIVLNPSEEAENETEHSEEFIYSNIISTYKNAVLNNFFNGEQSACGDINFELYLSAYKDSDLAYSLVDLCNDGEPELIIAALNSNYNGGYQIYDIWGQENGVPYRIFDIGTMGYRSIYSITTDNQFMLTYRDTETWGEPGYEYPVQIIYNKKYQLTPCSSNAVFTEGFKREVIGDEEFYCYYIDENGNEINPFWDDDYSYFRNSTGMDYNDPYGVPKQNLTWEIVGEM